jgi:hypothetical protein
MSETEIVEDADIVDELDEAASALEGPAALWDDGPALGWDAEPVEPAPRSRRADVREESVEEAEAPSDEEGPTRRRRRRRRRGGRSDEEGSAEPSDAASRPAVEEDDFGFAEELFVDDEVEETRPSDESDEAETPARRGRGRGRRRRRTGEEEGTAAAPRPARKAAAESVEETDEDEDLSEARHRNIPTWMETVDLLVLPNMENRKRGGGRSEPRRGGRGGRGRRSD